MNLPEWVVNNHSNLVPSFYGKRRDVDALLLSREVKIMVKTVLFAFTVSPK